MKAILVLVLLMAIIISGCTSGASQQGSNTSNTSQANAAGTIKGNDQIIAKTPESSATNGATSRLKNILAAPVNYKVTYDINTAGITTQMTQYMSGDKLRIDMSSGGLDVQTYYLNNSYIVCNKATGNWMCQKMDSVPTVNYNAQNDVRKNIDAFSVTSSGTKIVAGVTANCYTTSKANSTVEYCYSNDYVPLYIRSSAGNISTEMVAKSYSTSVSDADFVAPADASAPISTNPADYVNYQQ